jgi:ankyrin repeat protein
MFDSVFPRPLHIIDPNSKDSKGQAPLSCATNERHVSDVQLLLAKEEVSAGLKERNGRIPL